ncbi:hypothetical protein DDZ13_00400 [Coraliomargarita sinensis]|uniref:Uncharacterized protein n=1 Tax=Coraliomargarita sinensis TaxID=2174842 RepID=A0A317ZIL7_9BACT|nr:substrate-binding domain-containing protein [Coraliomargarita sinensis]PXA05360.1 hypothetical protein DDZ13_00400 [Coraliomargarita sinensis]
MQSFHPKNVAEQVAEHLRSEIASRRLFGEMPGIHQLAAKLSVNHKTVKTALGTLEKEGLLVPQGPGKRRKIENSPRGKPRGMRIVILLYEPSDREVHYLNRLEHELQAAKHDCFFAERTLTDLKMDVTRVAAYVAETEADAWVVVAGSQPILQWFAAQDFPAFALFGRSMEVSIAKTGPKKAPAQTKLIRQLYELGHRRIVLLSREERRKPEPGFLEKLFLNELESLGIRTGSYNLPDWPERPGGLQETLDHIFRHTPPTAILIPTAPLFFALFQYAARKGIKIPEDLSVVCMDPDPAYQWCQPQISHITYDSQPWIRRIVRWANHAASGREDRRGIFYPGKLVEGGTIGPAKGL